MEFQSEANLIIDESIVDDSQKKKGSRKDGDSEGDDSSSVSSGKVFWTILKLDRYLE